MTGLGLGVFAKIVWDVIGRDEEDLEEWIMEEEE